MAVKKSDTGSFVKDIRNMVNNETNPKIFITLFESEKSLSLIKNAAELVNVDVCGVIADDSLLNCRNESLHDKIRFINKKSGYDIYTMKNIKKLSDRGDNIVIVVQNKKEFLDKIINVFENSGINCTVFHVSELTVKSFKDSSVAPLTGDKYAMKDVYDIGMPCVMLNDNIGSVLTYYALYRVLTDMKYSVLPIERPLDAPLQVSDDAKAFNKRWVPDNAQPVQFDSVADMTQLNDRCKYFVLGSDQLFLESMCAKRKHFFMMQWVDDSKKRIAYATSFGGPGARGSEEYYKKLTYHLNKFEYISCREDDGVNFANNSLHLKKNVEFVLDPVFLCDKKYYKELVDYAQKDRTQEYIGAYVIIPRGAISKLITNTSRHFGNLPVDIIGDPVKAKAEPRFEYDCKDPFPIENALELIYNSKYFVTDSFHGVCFAIIFRKDFLVIPRDFIDRFTTLLNRIGLGDRIVKNDYSNFSEKLYNPIDWDAVYTKLDAEIKRSKGKLSEELRKMQVDSPNAERDMIIEYVRALEDEISGLKDEIQQMKNDSDKSEA